MTTGKKITLGFLIIASLSLMGIAGACDQTELEGTISPSPIETRVGETITLTLAVPSDLKEIHRETWQVEPESLGTIECVSSGEKCRKAIFTATSPGSGTVGVWGFYKQTNPQFIAETKIIVTD
ncbi:MAG: hypothetical protein DRI01_04520 [Chloroflexi bacterium]|nr:MAG: hypothetical protein DRI01_04520 [Chloroflexota bacterium]